MNDASYRDYLRKVWILIALAAGLAIAVVYMSDTSLYHVSGMTQTNLDIALMLTPWGVLNNLWIQTDHWLRPYYSEPAARHGLFDDLSLRLSVAAIWGFAIALLFVGYRREQESKK